MITGTSSGFGLALAKAALAAGDRVIATARHPDTLDELVHQAPDRVAPVRLDVTRPTDITAAVAAGLERFESIDVLVNKAGYGSVGAVEEIAMPELEQLHATMFLGPVRLAQAVLPHMRARRAGVIVQISLDGRPARASRVRRVLLGQVRARGNVGITRGRGRSARDPRADRRTGGVPHRVGADRMHRSRTIIDDYADTAGPNRTAVDQMDGSQPGDPDRAAAAILGVIDADDPPLRLALGDDAVDAIRAKHDQLRADLDVWEHLSRSTTLVRA